jgi:acetyl-CoA/propionyl-CoA carboxylase, biotin carboxylase, biotin carboxyl carrier protein
VRAEELVAQSHKVPPSGSGRLVERVTPVEVDGRRFEVTVLASEAPWLELARTRRERADVSGHGASGAVVSPMQGTVLSVAVTEGDAVEAGTVLCVVEAMKMENEIAAHRSGVVTELTVAEGEPVQNGQVICVLAGDE